MKSLPPHEIEKAANRLAAFVYRSRLVTENLVGSDLENWEARTVYQKQITVTEDHSDPDNPTVQFQFAEQELAGFAETVAALALCRPFYLERDQVFHRRVFKDIKLLRGDALDRGSAEALDSLASQFEVGAYTRQPAKDPRFNGSSKFSLTDKDITSSWIYGFLLHDDPDRQGLLPVADLKDDFYAIAFRAANQVVAVAWSLLWIEAELKDEPEFFPDAACWSAEVKVPSTYTRPGEFDLYVGESKPKLSLGADSIEALLPGMKKIDSPADLHTLFSSRSDSTK